MLASGRIGAATLEVRDFGAGGLAVRRSTTDERAELARFRDRAEARVVLHLLADALARADAAAASRRSSPRSPAAR